MDQVKVQKFIKLVGPFMLTVAGIAATMVLKLQDTKTGEYVVYMSFAIPLFSIAFSLSRAGDKLDEYGKKIDEQGKKIDQQANKLEEHGKKIDEHGANIGSLLKKYEASLPLHSVMRISAAPLTEMEQFVRSATQRIDLMYLSAAPKQDVLTKAYWDQTTEHYLKRQAQTTVRRIASVPNVAKLAFLLENNATYLAAGDALAGVDYTLVLFPDHDLRPPQFDIIDDAVFLFSPYGGKTIVLRDPTMVEGYARRFAELFAELAPKLTLLSTAGKKPPAPTKPCCYSARELKTLITLIQSLPELAAPSALDQLKPLIHPYSSGDLADWGAFKKACASSRGAGSMVA